MLCSFRCWEQCSIKQDSDPHVVCHADLIPKQTLSPFSQSSYYMIFLQGNNSVYHFYSRTEPVLSWELLAALLGKGEAVQGEWSPVPSGSRSSLSELTEFVLWPRDLCSTAQPEGHALYAAQCSAAQARVRSCQLHCGSLAGRCTMVFQWGSLHVSSLGVISIMWRECSVSSNRGVWQFSSSRLHIQSGVDSNSWNENYILTQKSRCIFVTVLFPEGTWRGRGDANLYFLFNFSSLCMQCLLGIVQIISTILLSINKICERKK